MNKLTIAFSAAAFLYLVAAIFVGARELSMIQLSQKSPARQFEEIAKKEFSPGFSLQAEYIVLKSCHEAMVRILGRLQPTSLRAQVAANCSEIANQITASSPTASYAHLIAALAALERNDYAGFTGSYILSQASGPNEAWIAQARFLLGERGISELNKISRLAHEADLALLVQSEFGLQTVVSQYLERPASRERISTVVENLSEADQRRFVAALKNHIGVSGAGS